MSAPQVATVFKEQPPSPARMVFVACALCPHRWPFTVTTVAAGLWVVQCPRCRNFMPPEWCAALFKGRMVMPEETCEVCENKRSVVARDLNGVDYVYSCPRCGND